MTSHGPLDRHTRHVIAVGQLSCDTIIGLDRALALGDHNPCSSWALPGGTAAIVAHNLAVLGGHATFTGHIGTSLEHAAAARQLRVAGVEIGPLVRTTHGLRVVIVVERDGERTMFASGDQPPWSELHLASTCRDIVFFEGWPLLAETPDPAYLALIHDTASTGATVVMDVCTANNASAHQRELLGDLPIDILLANHAEASALNLLHDPISPTTIVHRGVEPTALLSNGTHRDFPVQPVTPLDTTGAGDTFAAALLLELSVGGGLDRAVCRGLAAARDVVQVAGPLLRIPHPHAQASSDPIAL